MAQPPAYTRFQNFTDWQTANPGQIFNGTDLDGEFNRIVTTCAAVLANLALIQRDDGELASGSVGRDQLDPSIASGVGTPTSWTTGHAYGATDSVIFGAAWYFATVAHTSGSDFATDLGAGKWTLIFDFTSLPTTVPPDGSVTTAKLANLAVTAAKIANNTITNAQIANDTINANQLASASVGTAELATNAVTTAKITDSQVTTAKIADANVTTAKILDANVTTAKLADGAVTAAKEADEDYSDIASAGTCAIGGVASRHVRVTGTTTITSFGTIAAGRRRRCKLASTPTITHNGTSLICPGGASIVGEAGDTFDAISRGSGNWEIQNYQRASGAALVVAAAAAIPAGTIMAYAGTAAPTGWSLVDGGTLSRIGEAALFAAIGTTYGAGDGSTTFNKPDLRGRVPVGKDNMGGSAASRMTGTTMTPDGESLGATGGAQTHTLTTPQIPGHTHDVPWFAGGVGGSLTKPASGNSSSSPTATTSTGGGGAHNNTQPSLILNYIIKL